MAREAHSQTKSRDPPDRELGQGPESGSVTLATGRSSVTVQDPHRVCRTDRPHREPGCEKRESPRVSGGEAGPPRPLPIPAFPGEREGGCAGTCTVRHWSKQPLRERAPATSPRPWVVVLLEFLTCCYTRIPRSRDSSFCYFLLKKQRHRNLQGTVCTLRCNQAYRCTPASSCGTSCQAIPCPGTFLARRGFFSQWVLVPGTSKPPKLEQRRTPETTSS